MESSSELANAATVALVAFVAFVVLLTIVAFDRLETSVEFEEEEEVLVPFETS